MRTVEDRVKQAQAEIDAALAKRSRAKQLWLDAEEELTMARLKLLDLSKEIKRRTGSEP